MFLSSNLTNLTSPSNKNKHATRTIQSTCPSTAQRDVMTTSSQHSAPFPHVSMLNNCFSMPACRYPIPDLQSSSCTMQTGRIDFHVLLSSHLSISWMMKHGMPIHSATWFKCSTGMRPTMEKDVSHSSILSKFFLISYFHT